ncbi:hypothetical protein D9M68_518960 [compost metagenome]|jgi:hypothetical protein
MAPDKTIDGNDVHHHPLSIPRWLPRRHYRSIGPAANRNETNAMPADPRISDGLYQVTHVTLDELRLHFETEVVVGLEDGRLAVRQAPTPVAERKALRELICAAQAA